jgi:hypothetical protein
MQNVQKILEKYNHFRDAQIRSVENTPNSMVVTLVLQDDDGEDLNSVLVELIDVQKSRILQNHVLGYLDMMSGISIIKENNLYGFALGQGSAMLHVHNAPMYIISKDIKIQD